MNSIFKFFIRISSFFNKELAEIFRQPKLILVLILGPFLIMFLFGLGYPDKNRPLRTVFVMEDQNIPPEQVKLFTESLGESFAQEDVETSKETALAKLARNQTDLVIVIPANAVETIQSNQKATFLIYHNEVDPFQIGYIYSIGSIYVDEVNRRVLESATEQGQGDAGSLQTSLEDAMAKTQELRQTISLGDTNTASQVDELLKSLNDTHDKLRQFRSMSSSVLVNPFTSDVSGLSPEQFSPTDFFAPAVIVLLLQHLSITFASLSIVRERRSGIMELFKVSPLTAFEILLGKFLTYLFFEIILAAIITGLAVFVLGTPMFGNWWHYALAVFILLFTSLGLGFLISLISETDTQAVQYSMLLLLASIFFSGFLLDLRLMWKPMTILAWSLPATYGIRMLQDIMLRGAPIPLFIFGGIAIIGIVIFIINWIILRKRIEVQYSSI
jgi:ABC-2 type transport system permease protein